jgi:hypothetical protein
MGGAARFVLAGSGKSRQSRFGVEWRVEEGYRKSRQSWIGLSSHAEARTAGFVSARQSRSGVDGTSRLVRVRYCKAVKARKVQAGPVPGSARQGSHGSVGHVGEGEGVMVNQGSLGTARRGLLGYRKATQSGRVRSGLCLARQVGLAQRKAVKVRGERLVEGVMAWKRMAVRSRQGPARTGPSSRVIARQRKAVRAS